MAGVNHNSKAETNRKRKHEEDLKDVMISQKKKKKSKREKAISDSSENNIKIERKTETATVQASDNAPEIQKEHKLSKKERKGKEKKKTFLRTFDDSNVLENVQKVNVKGTEDYANDFSKDNSVIISLSEEKNKEKKKKKIKSEIHSHNTKIDGKTETKIVPDIIATENQEGNDDKSIKKKKTKKKRIFNSSLGTVDNELIENAMQNYEDNRMEEENTALSNSNEASEDEETEHFVSDKSLKKSKKKKSKKNSSKEKEENVSSNSQNPVSRNERALKYLHNWNSDRGSWKFNKMHQVNLIHMMFDSSIMDDNDFQILLLYLTGMKGKAKETTNQQALKLVNNDMKIGEEISKLKEQRAREIAQVLS